jgi:hypothetical protein
LAVINNNNKGDIMNRIIQFFGQGYGTDPAFVVARLEDLVVYEGNVHTIDQIGFNTAPETQVVLFTCELPVTFEGLKPMSVEVITGTVVLAHVHATHCYANCNDLYFPLCPGSDVRKNVKIDNKLQVPDQELPGTWSWTVSSGSTLSCDLDIVGGYES